MAHSFYDDTSGTTDDEFDRPMSPRRTQSCPELTPQDSSQDVSMTLAGVASTSTVVTKVSARWADIFDEQQTAVPLSQTVPSTVTGERFVDTVTATASTDWQSTGGSEATAESDESSCGSSSQHRSDESSCGSSLTHLTHTSLTQQDVDQLNDAPDSIQKMMDFMRESRVNPGVG